MAEKQPTILPKWPFLTGDIVLVLLACFIVIASPKPMNAMTIFACALSIILGVLVYVTPYLVEHFTRQQNIALKQVKAEETLLRAVELASDLLTRAESVHADLMKSILVTKQVPAKLEETSEALLEILSANDEKGLISLKNEIKNLKDTNVSSANPGDILEIKDAIASLKISGPTELTLTKSQKETFESLKTIAKSQSTSFKQLETQLAQIQEDLVELKSSSQDSQERFENRSIPDEENPTTDTGEIIPESETEEASTVDSIIENETVEELTEDGNDEELNEETTSEAPGEEPEDLFEDLNESNEEGFASDNEDGSTRLLIGAFIGISNKLYIRGEGPGLNWDKGVPMDLVGIGKWEWKTFDAKSPVACKVLINDEQSTNDEDIVLHPGTTVETNASF